MRHDELAERLEAFAAATLDPDPEAMSQVRAVIVARAERERCAPAAAGRRALFVPVFGPIFGRLRSSTANLAVVRRIGYAAGSVALVLSMATGAMAASGPGGPFYDARLWFETMGLPANGSARANSELPILDARLKEAREAAARGDNGALQAALSAYEKTLADAAKNAGPDDRSKLDSMLQKHVDVLEGLLGDTGGKSGQAIQKAIDRANGQIENGGNNGQGGDNGQGPDKTPHPHPTPKGGKH